MLSLQRSDVLLACSPTGCWKLQSSWTLDRVGVGSTPAACQVWRRQYSHEICTWSLWQSVPGWSYFFPWIGLVLWGPRWLWSCAVQVSPCLPCWTLVLVEWPKANTMWLPHLRAPLQISPLLQTVPTISSIVLAGSKPLVSVFELWAMLLVSCWTQHRTLFHSSRCP